MPRADAEHKASLWRLLPTVVLFLLIVFMVMGGTSGVTEPPLAVGIHVGIILAGIVLATALVMWCQQHQLSWFRAWFDPAPEPTPADPTEQLPPGARNWTDLPAGVRKRLLVELRSPIEERRRHAVHLLSWLADTPVGRVECWPAHTYGNLKLAAAEHLLRHWADFVEVSPHLTEDQLVHLMFADELVDQRGRPRPRVTPELNSAPPPFVAPAAPSPPTAFDRAIDRLGDVVKDALLDRPGSEEESEFAAPEEDQPLGPLDRERFSAELNRRFAAVADHITDAVAQPPTDFELAKREEEVGKFLHEFRWDVLTLALDLRAGAPLDPVPSQPVRQSDAWARKYRRMRALGP